MTRVFTIFTILMSAVMLAQQPIEKTIGEFKELKVYDLIEVKMIKSKEDKVIISGQNSEYVLVNNKNGTLKIKMSLKQIFDGDKTKVTLYYSGVDIIDANEGARIYVDNTIKQFEIDLRVQEGAKIEVKLDTDYTNAKAVTGGIINVSGKSKSQKISLLTGGVYNGETLKTDKTNVSINVAGEAYVNASDVVDIKIRAGGDVYIYGNPKTINESKVLGGRVKRMEN
ncbi:head GIN domain-containing protein [Snuella sedimenti]|uniref:DUF2807 domain-containing protein n=1 Tax=Snuella sedimenti TaxID=2798802 RepID=A0A8J7LTJ2_9FLAO|nr:head GIN domain-containing protein [Snuella sedimenti]MBJ6368436.1 DUF2807 domain-containing protein [Snuella sedimenti]